MERKTVPMLLTELSACLDAMQEERSRARRAEHSVVAHKILLELLKCAGAPGGAR